MIKDSVHKAREADDADLLFDLIFMDMDSVDLDVLIDQVQIMYNEQMEGLIPIFIAMSSKSSDEVLNEIQQTKVNYFV